MIVRGVQQTTNLEAALSLFYLDISRTWTSVSTRQVGIAAIL
ncbi:hypothetical protein [Peribacillus sp. NPDC097295]